MFENDETTCKYYVTKQNYGKMLLQSNYGLMHDNYYYVRDENVN